jgi:microsomal dipeptidase-like Zn-dependent dipeptidase
MQALAASLKARGWDDGDVEAVMGGNLLGLFTAVCG